MIANVSIGGNLYQQRVATYTNQYAAPKPAARSLPDAVLSSSRDTKTIIYKEIRFRDPNDETKLVSLRLDTRLIDALIKKFGAKSARFDSDGGVTLEKGAEKFIAGYYKSFLEGFGEERAIGIFSGNNIFSGAYGASVQLNFNYENGEIVSIASHAKRSAITLNNACAMLGRLSPMDRLAEALNDLKSSLSSSDYIELGAKYTAAVISADYHATMIDLMNKTMQSGSIEEALNRALETDRNLDGKIEFEEIIFARYDGEKTAQETLQNLTNNYIARAQKVLKDNRIESKIKLRLSENFAPDLDAKERQNLRVITLEEIGDTLNEISEALQEASKKREQTNDAPAAQILQEHIASYDAKISLAKAIGTEQYLRLLESAKTQLTFNPIANSPRPDNIANSRNLLKTIDRPISPHIVDRKSSAPTATANIDNAFLDDATAANSRFTAKNVIFDDKANESSRFAANRARGNFEAANSFGVAQTYKSSLNGFAVYAAATQNAFQSSFQISSFTAIA